MALFFITGPSGAGKSQVTRELRARGYQALDTDDDALARWQNKETGYIHPKSSVKPEQRTPEFLAQHEWNVPREYVEDFASNVHDQPAFICGVANNYEALSDLFQGVFALHIDDKTLEHRLRTRTNNNWGKQAHELQQSLDEHQGMRERHQQQGYVMIDASQPLDAVVSEIIDGAIALDDVR